MLGVPGVVRQLGEVVYYVSRCLVEFGSLSLQGRSCYPCYSTSRNWCNRLRSLSNYLAPLPITLLGA
jgi:hypothetical protein